MRIGLSPPPTYFVHVPKTGGVSLGSLLESAYLPGQRIRLNPPRMRHLTLERFRRYRCYHAMHQGRGLLELTGRTDLACITIVREPVERAISWILYLQRMMRQIPHTFTREYREAVVPLLDAPLEVWADHDVFEQACDSQLRTLGMLEDYTPLFRGSPDAASGRSLLRPYPLPYLMNGHDRDQMLENATRWVDSMAVVGTTEHYSETVELLCELLGIRRPRTLPYQNANPARVDAGSRYRSQLCPRLIGQIEERTTHDRQLYEFAREKFREQWSRHRTRPRRTYSIGPRFWTPIGRATTVVGTPLRRLAGRMLGRPAP